MNKEDYIGISLTDAPKGLKAWLLKKAKKEKYKKLSPYIKDGWIAEYEKELKAKRAKKVKA